MTHAEWTQEGIRRFGADGLKWRFVCPVCQHVAKVEDWRAAGAPMGAVAFSCVGRWQPGIRDALRGVGPGPCNYTGGGLFTLNPVRITAMPYGQEDRDLFEFAEPET